MADSWLRDLAVEIGDWIDTPDFLSDPSGNATTIDEVEGMLVRALAKRYGFRYVKTGHRRYDVDVAGHTIGYVYAVGSGSSTTWNCEPERRRHGPARGMETRNHAVEVLVDRYR